MTDLRWPAPLPQSLPLDTDVSDLEENTIVTESGAGPRRKRRRFTNVSRLLQPPSARMVYTETQVRTLLEFYESVTESGTLSFMWVDPIAGVGDVEMSFEARPRTRHIVSGSPGYYTVEVQFEVFAT